MRLLLLCAFLGGCLDSALVPCGAVSCPIGSTCIADDRCASAAELAACASKAEGDDCIVESSTGHCLNGACSTFACGNGVVELGEVCDDGNRTSGDGCSYDCLSNETCGNGYTDFATGEQCDDGNLIDGDGCEHDCKLPTCGNGIVDEGEACDDGNRIDGDGCSRDCASNETCGNGIRDPGEECDDGNNIDHDGCQSNCKVQRCGDGILDPGEQCDDGNFDETDACLNTCKTARCGDGFVWAGHEQCDDGNSENSDDCPSSCQNAHCGDGYTWTGHEDCDDANTNETDCCHNNCTNPVCGDGVIECTERCDDGSNNGSNGTCRDQCQTACGVGIKFYTPPPVEMTPDGSVSPDTGTALLAGEFGGATYGIDESDQSLIFWGPQNLTDGSQLVGLTPTSAPAFTQVGITGEYTGTGGYCSADGNGTITPGIVLTVIDSCGVTLTYSLLSDTPVGGSWPVCQ